MKAGTFYLSAIIIFSIPLIWGILLTCIFVKELISGELFTLRDKRSIVGPILLCFSLWMVITNIRNYYIYQKEKKTK